MMDKTDKRKIMRELARKKRKKPGDKNKKKLNIRLNEKQIIGGIGGLFGLFVAFVFWASTWPSTGPIQYGICRTFAELQLVYPNSLEVTTIDRFKNTHGLYYTFIDAFGMHRSQLMECTFTTTPEGQLKITKVSINGKPFHDQEKIDRFNLSIPAVIAAKPDLSYYKLDPQNLASLKTGYD